MTSSDSLPNRNAVVIVGDGQVKAVVDKQHPVPFVERHPPGTRWLRDVGLIPDTTDRQIATVTPQDTDRGNRSDACDPWVIGICYDIFFPRTFWRFRLHKTDVIICCLSETFDESGVFQQLSTIHSRLRAVEFSRPVIRSSFDASSNVYDSVGRLVAPQARRGIVTVYEIRSSCWWSLYARLGDWFPMACVVVTIGMLFVFDDGMD